jgi:hypothetical protein
MDVSDLIRADLKQWSSVVYESWSSCLTHQDCLFSRTVQWDPDSPRSQHLFWLIKAIRCPLVALSKDACDGVDFLTEQEAEIASYSTFYFEHASDTLDSSYSLLFSFSFIVERTVRVPSHWKARNLHLPPLGDFRRHIWAPSEYKIKAVAIGFRK